MPDVDFAMDFGPHDLLQCNISVNASQLFNVLQHLLRQAQHTTRRMDDMDTSMKDLVAQMDIAKTGMEHRLNDFMTGMNGRLDTLRRETIKEMDDLRQQRDDRSSKFSSDLALLRKEVANAKESLTTKIDEAAKDQNSTLESLREQLDRETKMLNEDLTGATRRIDNTLGDHSQQLDDHTGRLNTTGREVRNLYSLFDMATNDVDSWVQHEDVEGRITKVHNTPAFARIIANNTKDRQRFETKFDNVHKRVGNVEQQMSRKAEVSDVDELREVLERDDVKQRLNDAQKNIKELFSITEYTDKALSVGLERKADKTRLDGLEEDVEMLEVKVKEAIEAVGGNRFQQIVDKIGDIDHYVQKMDRRKVGRSELQRLTKRIRGNGVGAEAYDADPTSPEAGGLSITGHTHGLDEDMTSNAAFLRYRCLSCNKPSAKLADEGMPKPTKTFPPSPILTTSIGPGSPAGSANGRIPPVTAPTNSSRTDKKMDNYFRWVDSHRDGVGGGSGGGGSIPAHSDAGRPASAAMSRSSSPPVAPPQAETAEQKRIRTSLIGTDNKLYQGLQEVRVDPKAKRLPAHLAVHAERSANAHNNSAE